jgi:hypothetical protein
VEQREASLERLPRGMRDAVAEVLEPGEQVVAAWTTRGLGANALICTPTRALIAKRQFISWSVAAFPYPEVASVEVLEGRPGSAAQLILVPPEPETPLRALETKALLPLDEVARIVLDVVGSDARRQPSAVAG